MKRFILSLVPLLVVTLISAQQPVPKTFPKTITVSGSAEMEITPNEIHVAVTLKEYEKKGKSKVTIDAIQKQFLQNVRKAGIPDSLIKVMNYGGNSGMHWWKKKPVNDVMLSSIVYELIFSEPKQVEALIKLLDEDATEQFAVTLITHTNMSAMQKQLRINATKAAKEKAIYLSDAVGEKIGHAINISEIPLMEPYFRKAANTIEHFAADAVDPAPEFSKLKLRSEMNVVFELL
ncbi:MAG: DUF541 domain-containing protein [Chitinophagaceae bacterium]|nr:MAG: DUF541 domain-containing protein [Chitinophagaceae bacterium]